RHGDEEPPGRRGVLPRDDARGIRARPTAHARSVPRRPADRAEVQPAVSAGVVRVQDRLRRVVCAALARRAAGDGQRRTPARLARGRLDGLVRRGRAFPDQPRVARAACRADVTDRHGPGTGRPVRLADAAWPLAEAEIPWDRHGETPRPCGTTMTTATAAPSTLLALAGATCHERDGSRRLSVRRRMCDHPHFELPRLLQLAKALPEDRVEYSSGELPVGVDPALTPRTGLSIEETVRRI